MQWRGRIVGGNNDLLFVWSEWVEWGVESAQPFRLDWHEKEMAFSWLDRCGVRNRRGSVGSWNLFRNLGIDGWHSLVVHDPTNRNGREDSNGIGKCGRVCAAQG